MAGPSVSQSSAVRDEPRRKMVPAASTSAAPRAQGGYGAQGAQGARAWHQGLARQKAEVEASVQDYRRLLLKSLKTLSQAGYHWWCRCIMQKC